MSYFTNIGGEMIDFDKLQKSIMIIKQKFPNKIPVIVTKSNVKNTDIPDPAPGKKYVKYLVPNDITVGQFVYTIRKKMNLQPEKAIFIFVNNKIPPTSMMMSQLYDKEKGDSGYLLMTYSGENTFGV
jgi:GABA(A) receptor-associated protein